MSPCEAASSPYDYEHLGDYVSQSPARPVRAVEPRRGQDQRSPWSLEGDPYTTNPRTSSFVALEFSTSPLPPSSPLPSSTTYGLLLSPHQKSHETETTILDSDRVPSPFIMSGFSEHGTSRYVSSCRVAPDLASASPLRHCPHSDLADEVPTLPVASSSGAELITALLACDNPWNAIGDVMGLPPIPSPDATYFDNIRSLRTLSPERASSLASPSPGQTDIREPPSPARLQVERTRLSGIHSDGDLLVQRDSSQIDVPLLCSYPGTYPLRDFVLLHRRFTLAARLVSLNLTVSHLQRAIPFLTSLLNLCLCLRTCQYHIDPQTVPPERAQ